MHGAEIDDVMRLERAIVVGDILSPKYEPLMLRRHSNFLLQLQKRLRNNLLQKDNTSDFDLT